MCSVEHIFDNAELRAGPPRRSRMTLSAGDDDVMDDGPLERLRRICLALPETTERLSHGEPNWFVRGKKTFVSYADRHHDDRAAFWCAAPPGAQQALVAEQPEIGRASGREREERWGGG